MSIQGHIGLEITKRYSSCSFHPIWAHLYDQYGSHREYKVMDIVVICQNFSMGVNGKHKMWHISQTADRTAKRMKIWDSGYSGNFC